MPGFFRREVTEIAEDFGRVAACLTPLAKDLLPVRVVHAVVKHLEGHKLLAFLVVMLFVRLIGPMMNPWADNDRIGDPRALHTHQGQDSPFRPEVGINRHAVEGLVELLTTPESHGRRHGPRAKVHGGRKDLARVLNRLVPYEVHEDHWP